MFKYSAPYRWFYSPKTTWKNITYFFRWVRNIFIRGMNGWCKEDTWSWFDYITDINIEALEYYKEHKCGFPCGFDEDTKTAEERWDKQLDEMIAGFKAVKKLSNLEFMDDNPDWRKEEEKLIEIKDKGLKTYIENFMGLWD